MSEIAGTDALRDESDCRREVSVGRGHEQAFALAGEFGESSSFRARRRERLLGHDMATAFERHLHEGGVLVGWRGDHDQVAGVEHILDGLDDGHGRPASAQRLAPRLASRQDRADGGESARQQSVQHAKVLLHDAAGSDETHRHRRLHRQPRHGRALRFAAHASRSSVRRCRS